LEFPREVEIHSESDIIIFNYYGRYEVINNSMQRRWIDYSNVVIDNEIHNYNLNVRTIKDTTRTVLFGDNVLIEINGSNDFNIIADSIYKNGKINDICKDTDSTYYILNKSIYKILYGGVVKEKIDVPSCDFVQSLKNVNGILYLVTQKSYKYYLYKTNSSKIDWILLASYETGCGFAIYRDYILFDYWYYDSTKISGREQVKIFNRDTLHTSTSIKKYIIDKNDIYAEDLEGKWYFGDIENGLIQMDDSVIYILKNDIGEIGICTDKALNIKGGHERSIDYPKSMSIKDIIENNKNDRMILTGYRNRHKIIWESLRKEKDIKINGDLKRIYGGTFEECGEGYLLVAEQSQMYISNDGTENVKIPEIWQPIYGNNPTVAKGKCNEVFITGFYGYARIDLDTLLSKKDMFDIDWINPVWPNICLKVNITNDGKKYSCLFFDGADFEIFESTDAGITWTEDKSALGENEYIYQMYADYPEIILITDIGLKYRNKRYEWKYLSIRDDEKDVKASMYEYNNDLWIARTYWENNGYWLVIYQCSNEKSTRYRIRQNNIIVNNIKAKNDSIFIATNIGLILIKHDDIVNVERENETDNMTIYPMPIINIKYIYIKTSTKIQEYTIYDQALRRIDTGIVNCEHAVLPIIKLKSGVYILSLKTLRRQINKKIIILN
jgi:hypothetical protein